MIEPDYSSLKSLIAILEISDKAELQQHCRDTIIYKSDLAALIMACMSGAVSINHFPFFKHDHPEHLVPTKEDRVAFSDQGIGRPTKESQKFINKISGLIEQRRLFNGHLFIPIPYPNEWHLFYFDQRDVEKHRNHWENGEHIHLINMVTHPQLSALDLIEKLEAERRPKLGGGLHIRYRR